MKKLFLLILMLLAFDFGFGQTTLSAGDIVITGFNSDTPDEFTFVLLTDITNTTTIKFTDNGWDTSAFPAPAFRSNEGTITWVANTDLPCGTTVTIINNGSLTPSTGSLTTSGSFALATAGDQILAYQGVDSSPTFIYAIISDSTGWSNSTSSNTSALPPGLSNGVNAVALGETRNAKYDCSIESNPALILSAVSDNLNWNTSNSLLTLGDCTFSCSPCASTVTWNGSSWSSTPDLTTEVILNDDYDTNSLPSFQACSLTVSSGNTLTIGDGTFVEVENDLTVEATAFIYVASQGAFVQNSDAGLVDVLGTVEVTKTTAPLNNWYEYTYWSSPVANADIDNGLSEAKSNRRYSFNAQNFLDATAETNNNNATVAGQDDIDDNGDDWFNVNGTTVMQPGVGYAAMHDPAGFAGPGGPSYQFDYIFSGPFNNGVISVPIHRNDSETNDINWNFIGNPYPSAIDADLFLAANSNISTSVAGSGYINGAIFLWSQNTLPSATTNGNEPLNFSNDDYSIINASGETTGGDGTTAATLSNSNRAISSGQGFFVAFSDGAIPISTTGDISEGVITFNNSMRVTDVAANSVFFKGTSSKNTNIADKLWINLTSEVGVYNQILIAYVNGATNEDDGLTFDATKYPTNSGAALYSTIGNSNKKFAIQGKAVESINEEEVINLGFTNYINNEIPYTLSIDKLQGDFLNNNTVYLKDNLLNITHNLSDGNYNFTSETGAFTDRFEVVFKEENTLTVDDIINNESAFQIIQHDSDRVTFKTGTSATLKSIAIYDLFGRKVYQFKGGNSSETFNIPNIKTGIYLAKAELSTGVIITKKAIKR
ncbi:T9SS type A sorting domain-containing protein [Algibacter lectus]|nr:T9SS type A sorting domain-containing protein [Algibacter lectus]MWW24527.1 T9SS type A sorting domain-containing protein [Algibacter lectus]